MPECQRHLGALPTFAEFFRHPGSRRGGGGKKSAIWVSWKPRAEQVLFLTVQILFIHPDYWVRVHPPNNCHISASCTCLCIWVCFGFTCTEPKAEWEREWIFCRLWLFGGNDDDHRVKGSRFVLSTKYLHILWSTELCLASSKILTPHPPLHPASVSSSRTKGVHTRRAVGGGGKYFGRRQTLDWPLTV
jgi:hypothetical protein